MQRQLTATHYQSKLTKNNQTLYRQIFWLTELFFFFRSKFCEPDIFLFFLFFLFLCLNHRAHAFHLPLWLRSSSSSAIFFIEDMLTCHRESIGVNVIINDGWIPFSWVSFELHVGYLSQCHGLPWHLNRSKPASDWWLFFFFFLQRQAIMTAFKKAYCCFVIVTT